MLYLWKVAKVDRVHALGTFNWMLLARVVGRIPCGDLLWWSYEDLVSNKVITQVWETRLSSVGITQPLPTQKVTKVLWFIMANIMYIVIKLWICWSFMLPTTNLFYSFIFSLDGWVVQKVLSTYLFRILTLDSCVRWDTHATQVAPTKSYAGYFIMPIVLWAHLKCMLIKGRGYSEAFAMDYA